MTAQLLGVRQLDFTATDGSLVRGTQLFIAFEENGVTGRMTDKVFVKPEITIPKLEINKMVQLSFDRKGKVESIKAE